MKLTTIKLITLLIFSTGFVFAQEVVKNDKKEETKDLEEKAVILLRESIAEINNLRSIENRISFRNEMAGFMWVHDADEGEQMYIDITDDFAQLLTRTNAAVVSYGGLKDEMDFYSSRNSPTEKAKAVRKLYTALNVREQIVDSMARHDAELAFDFVVRTSEIVTVKSFRLRLNSQNEQLESKIISLMAVQDIDKALELGRKSLKRGFKHSLLSLLKKVHHKDKSKANDFAEEIIDKVISELKEPKDNFYEAYQVLEFGEVNLKKIKNKPDKSPVISEKLLIELADSFTDTLIGKKGVETYMLEDYYNIVRKFSPKSAKRLNARFKDELADVNKPSAAKDAADKVKEAMIEAAKMATDAAKDAADKVSLTPQQQAKLKLQKEKKEFFERLVKDDSKKLSDEEKAKFIGQAKQIIAKIENPMEKLMALSGLALKVKQLGDDKLASELMDEANILVNPQPRNYIDYMQVWMLAGGYAAVDADKAFPILEDTIYQLNDTISAFVKVGEFMDISGEIVSDNEIQIGSFGGRLSRDLLNSLKNSDDVMKNLAKADFDRTKGLAERFDRLEVRLMAKMLILQSILKKEEVKVITQAASKKIVK